MATYITAIHMVGGEKHEHISSVRWRSDTGSTGESTREQMVKWINDGGKAYVSDGRNTVQVLVVNATPPYLRTFADGKWTDNLLALPRY